jgi:energy-coupling factor transport system ATP-binding protein
MSFQNANNQFFKSTVKEELTAGPRMLGKNHDAWIQEICDLFELNAFLEKSPYRLSEGEKKRTAVASILAMKPELLILDEPAAGQDGRFREKLAAVLNILENRGSTILIVSHDLDFAGAVADRWILLENGVIQADGPPHMIQGHPALRANIIDGQTD